MVNEIKTSDPVDYTKGMVRSYLYVPELDKHLKKAGGYIGKNVVKIRQ